MNQPTIAVPALAALLIAVAVIPTAAGSDLGLAEKQAKRRSPACDNRVNNSLNKLLACVSVEGVREHQAALQAVAEAHGGQRTAGSSGYDASADYVEGVMRSLGYDVSLQEFSLQVWRQLGPSTLEQLTPAAVIYEPGVDFTPFTQSDPGDVSGPVRPVDLAIAAPQNSTSGCEVSDFAGFPAGAIALMQRGACSFRRKAEIAAAFGAVGAIIFNQGNTEARKVFYTGTLTADYVGGIPVYSAPFARGVEWAGTPGLMLHMVADVFRGTATTSNVIAETPGGRADRVIMAGAHLDSVPEGPGVQDNGSGVGALLEIARQMKKVKPVNRVRFAFWGAEEFGLVGSTAYVEALSQEQLDGIALYLNFDMIGSPNFVRFVLDGDGSEFGLTGPPGSEDIEARFAGFYAARGLASKGSPIDFRSDYAAFFTVGIPFGGLFTGADGIKSPEEAVTYGGTAGELYDPCYHLSGDTFDNVSLEVLDLNADAVAAIIFGYAMSDAPVAGAVAATRRVRPSAVIERWGDDAVR